MLYHHRFIWQQSQEYIYPAKEIIFICYYNRNETETVVADQLKQASNNYYPSRIYRIDENYFINTSLQAQGYSPIRPLPKVTIAHYWCILQLFDLCSKPHSLAAIIGPVATVQGRPKGFCSPHGSDGLLAAHRLTTGARE